MIFGGPLSCFIATIKINSDVSVTLSLFDSQAVSFHKLLDGFRIDPRVAATSINPKIFDSHVPYLNVSQTIVWTSKVADIEITNG
ncbi:unnamed protein product [Eruca vesicaria subsp. sativa]|uniref:Uncharacterized protein n=1 Tax=Eruca vesicaria subsp. sativa TaxID=29727 RepID=A0ABC8M0K9_ERUVS|nr:unnamed protein product [Eruca vesicaria subsp. sativa]